MWWHDVQQLAERVAARHVNCGAHISSLAEVENGARVDDSAGPVSIGDRTRICSGAVLIGPIAIGADCLIGNNTMLRGPLLIGDAVRVGYACEIKQALVDDRVTIGPLCYVADSVVEKDAYLGAMVRTSNHRLDGAPVHVIEGVRSIATGLEKLGCRIGARSSLGIQVIVLPGRVIAPDTVFEPRVTVSRNYPQGHYRLRQDIECVTRNSIYS
jgi:NDP-sugar pyrophosphorylase family protein